MAQLIDLLPTYQSQFAALQADLVAALSKLGISEPQLSTALSKGLKLPYSCRGGVCGTCAAICKTGKVHMSINEVLTDEDIRKGWVLTCTGYPADEGTAISFG